MRAFESRRHVGGLPAWAALALLSHASGCVKATGPRAAPAHHIAPDTAPWPGVVRLAGPPPQVDCSNTMHDPALSWEQAADGSFRLARVLPRFWSSRDHDSSSTPAPIAAIPALECGAGDVRTIVSVDGGWLVAIDRGEDAGSGLYSVRAGDAGTQRLDGVLSQPVRWITKVGFGVVGVAGLCHGDACASRATAYQITRLSGDSSWQLYPLALLPGCPAAFATEPAGDSLLVASACGGLYRIGATGATRIAAWPQHLHPHQLASPRGNGAGAYYVSFGGVAARFTASAIEWYAPSDCPHLERGPDNLCRCVASATP